MLSMPVVNPHASGIDIGSKEHYVCVAQDNVKAFGPFTEDLHAICQHLQQHKVKTVALESTGFFWKPLFVMLQDYGFEVFLVNARHLKNVKGQKTDVVDSRWLQLLHSIGLLSNSFQPGLFTGKLRVYSRHRKSLIQGAAKQANIMNKALVLMNIQLKSVLRDLAGESALRVVESILQGERSPENLAKMVSLRVKATREQVYKAMEGDWREEYLFELQHAYGLYKYYQQMILQTDQKIEALLSQKPLNEGMPDRELYNPQKKSPSRKTTPE